MLSPKMNRNHMLPTMWSMPPCRNMEVKMCRKLNDDGVKPQFATTESSAANVNRNTTTLTAISAQLTNGVVEIGLSSPSGMPNCPLRSIDCTCAQEFLKLDYSNHIFKAERQEIVHA